MAYLECALRTHLSVPQVACMHVVISQADITFVDGRCACGLSARCDARWSQAAVVSNTTFVTGAFGAAANQSLNTIYANISRRVLLCSESTARDAC